MTTQGLRPFQPVVYLTAAIRDQLTWKDHTLNDLFDMTVLHSALDDQAILTLIALNDESNDDCCFTNPVPLGKDMLLRLWRQSSIDNQAANDTLDRIENLLSLRNQNSALETALTPNSDIEQSGDGFEPFHDDKAIYITLNTTQINLLDQTQFKPINTHIARCVTKILGIYNHYSAVSRSSWFKLYLEQL